MTMPRLIDLATPEHKEVVEALENAAQICTRAGLEFLLCALVQIDEDGKKVGTMDIHMGPRCSWMSNNRSDHFNAAISFLFQALVADPDNVKSVNTVRMPDGHLATEAENALLLANPSAEKPQ